MLIASCLSGMRSMPAQPTTVWSRRSSPPPGLNGGWREARGRASTCVGRCFGLGGEPRGGRGCGGGMGGGGSRAAQMTSTAESEGVQMPPPRENMRGAAQIAAAPSPSRALDSRALSSSAVDSRVDRLRACARIAEELMGDELDWRGHVVEHGAVDRLLEESVE